MLSLASRFARWVFAKFATGASMVVLAVVAGAIWVYIRDNVEFDQWRQEMMRTISGERAKHEAALADVNHRLTDLSAKIGSDKVRLQQADKVIAELKSLQSLWGRYFGDREQQRINDERLGRVEKLRGELDADISDLEQKFTRTTWERDGLEVALGKEDAKLRAIEAKRSKVFHYVERAWNYPVGRGVLRFPIKTWIALGLVTYFFGPTLGKLALFFGIAPLVVRGRPVRLEETLEVLPQVAKSEVAPEVVLRPGERLWIKEKFLQASDEGLLKQTKYLLDWRIPLTCVATRLVELIEMTNPNGAEHGELRVTLSNQGDPHSEIAIVTLAEGASLVLRPSFLAGAITSGTPLKIRRRWQLLRWQAWVTLQFRFFEFVGPCRLIVAGSRGVRVENLADREGPVLPARRTNQDATIGFTPNLDYRPVRAETFWSYYRGMNPLFDDLFAGRGIFLCQQVATEGDAKKARRFWSGIWGGVMKVFGL